MQTSDMKLDEFESTSNNHRKHYISIVYIFYSLLILAVSSLWIMQRSVNNYWQQTYHLNSPLALLNSSSVWRYGEKVDESLQTDLQFISSWIELQNTQLIGTINTCCLVHDNTIEKSSHPANTTTPTQTAAPVQQVRSPLFVGENDVVFFGGDSLMQGVAPYAQRWLQANHNIKTINLSKQSTGLAYPSFFDWPKTIQKNLELNANIRLVVIFLGPNDPWDMPNPEHPGGTYLKFESPAWESIYRLRIKNIIDTASLHHAHVLWLGPPNVSRDKLNQQMIYLTSIIQSEVEKDGATFLDTRALLGSTNDQFSETAIIADQGKVKVRSADGIHFSTAGQKLLSDFIVNKLQYQ